MEEYNADAEDSKISKYNSAFLINSRMDELWRHFHNSIAKRDYSKANVYLDRIWGELSGDATDDDEKAYGRIDQKMPHSKEFEPPRGFEKMMKNYIVALTRQYIFLMKKEMFLRKLQNRQGKGTAYYTDEDDVD